MDTVVWPGRRGVGPRVSMSARGWSVLVLLIAAAPLAVGAWLEPAGSGPAALGTHESMGFRACGFHERCGLPCATCGMTTSVTLAAHGHLLDAFLTQPAGAMFAFACAIAVVLAAWSIVTGVSLAPVGKALVKPGAFVILGLVLLLGWLYKTLGVVGMLT